MRITSGSTMSYIYENGSSRSKWQVARTTEDPELQKEIAGSDDIRTLVNLARNKNLTQEVEMTLAKRDNSRVNFALLSRKTK